MNASLRLLSLCLPFGWITAGSAQDPEPLFRKLVESGAYSESLTTYREKIEQAETLAATNMPAVGTKIGSVVPGSTAERLGITPGMLVAMLDGSPTFWSRDWKERTGPAEAVFFADDGKEMRHTVPPGLLGVNKLRYFRPELPLIRAHRGSREEAWYPHAVLGAITCESNPELAETAWSMATQEGYGDDLYSRFFAAMFSQLRPGTLHTSLDRFLEACNGPDGVPLWSQEVICGLLAADGRVSDLSKIMDQDSVYPIWSKEDLKQLQSLPSVTSPSLGGMDPLAYVNSRPFRFLNAEMEVINEFDAGMRQTGNRQPFSTPVVSIARSPGFYARTGLRYQSPVKNVHLRMDIARLGVTGHHEKYDEVLEVMLLANSSNPSRSREGIPAKENVLARATVGYLQTYSNEVKTPIFIFSAANLSTRWHAQTGSHRMQMPLRDGRTGFGFENLVFDLFRIENEVFVYINGSRYVRMPIAEDQGEPGVFFRCIGTSIFFNEFTFREYRP
jgi:hypothetical protein